MDNCPEMATGRHHTLILAILAAATLSVLSGACRRADPPAPPPQQVVAWRSVGSWSGRGNRQTESFTSASGALRVQWKATASKDAANNAKRAGPGVFRVTAHSAISGRLLEQVVDQSGPGSGTSYANQDPHVFYLMVEAEGLDWTIAVEEAIAGTVTGR